MDFNFDNKFPKFVIGVDEVGRGSWAGPIIAGAAFLNSRKYNLDQRLNDSKKISSNIRTEVLKNLQKKALFGIGIIDSSEIDKFGINKSTFKAMEIAVLDLKKKIGKKISTILIDGTINPVFKNSFGNAKKILIKKGDATSPSIAAASIFAKCNRDLHMKKMDKIYKGYGFNTNMGYGTNFHKIQINKIGLCKIHRVTFKPMSSL